MMSCEEISQRIRAMETRKGRDMGIDIAVEQILSLVEALNNHHVLIAKALLELCSPGGTGMGMSVETVRELSQMLIRD